MHMLETLLYVLCGTSGFWALFDFLCKFSFSKIFHRAVLATFIVTLFFQHHGHIIFSLTMLLKLIIYWKEPIIILIMFFPCTLILLGFLSLNFCTTSNWKIMTSISNVSHSRLGSRNDGAIVWVLDLVKLLLLLKLEASFILYYSFYFWTPLVIVLNSHFTFMLLGSFLIDLERFSLRRGGTTIVLISTRVIRMLHRSNWKSVTVH